MLARLEKTANNRLRFLTSRMLKRNPLFIGDRRQKRKFSDLDDLSKTVNCGGVSCGTCMTCQSRMTLPSLAVLTLNIHLTGRVALLAPPSCSQNAPAGGNAPLHAAEIFLVSHSRKRMLTYKIFEEHYNYILENPIRLQEKSGLV